MLNRHLHSIEQEARRNQKRRITPQTLNFNDASRQNYSALVNTEARVKSKKAEDIFTS